MVKISDTIITQNGVSTVSSTSAQNMAAASKTASAWKSKPTRAGTKVSGLPFEGMNGMDISYYQGWLRTHPNHTAEEKAAMLEELKARVDNYSGAMTSTSLLSENDSSYVPPSGLLSQGTAQDSYTVAQAVKDNASPTPSNVFIGGSSNQGGGVDVTSGTKQTYQYQAPKVQTTNAASEMLNQIAADKQQAANQPSAASLNPLGVINYSLDGIENTFAAQPEIPGNPSIPNGAGATNSNAVRSAARRRMGRASTIGLGAKSDDTVLSSSIVKLLGN